MNEVAYALRPYEIEAGATDAALDYGMDYLHEVFRKKQPWKLEEGMAKYLGGFSDTAEYEGKFVKQLKGDEHLPALQHCPDTFNEVEIDRLAVNRNAKTPGQARPQTTDA